MRGPFENKIARHEKAKETVRESGARAKRMEHDRASVESAVMESGKPQTASGYEKPLIPRTLLTSPVNLSESRTGRSSRRASS